MTMRNFKTDVGAALDMGTFTIVSDDLDGSTARLRIGIPGTAAFIELLSSESQDAPTAFTWTVVDGVGTLVVDLSQETLAPLTASSWNWVLHIILDSEEIVPLYDSRGELDGRGAITMKAIPLAAAS